MGFWSAAHGRERQPFYAELRSSGRLGPAGLIFFITATPTRDGAPRWNDSE